ncbi:hypothetical protein HGRIS_007203 [Hohenbuehelia grisea]|uniref:Uncharacterized protein n=1 Tax=Hohenbuehelia grisea TaxID=104357 RepID=A0ABR3JBY3_9AGAR
MSQPNPARARQQEKVPDDVRPDGETAGGKPHEHESQEEFYITHEPVVNPQARTHPLAGAGARWKGVPLEEDYQRALDENPDRGLSIGEGEGDTDDLHGRAPETIPERVEADGHQLESKAGNAGRKIKQAAGAGGGGGSDGDSSEDDKSRVSFGTKVKGQVKVLQGKVKSNQALVEEGKHMKRGGSEWD